MAEEWPWKAKRIVGSASYVLDLENYIGTALIDIGRRPAPVSAFGEIDESVAWGTFSGVKRRITQTGDVTLNAAAVTTGLTKDIFIGLGSDGTPAFHEVDNTYTGCDLCDCKTFERRDQK